MSEHPREDQSTIIANNDQRRTTKYCSVCSQSLPLNSFPKEKFAKTKGLVVKNESTASDDVVQQDPNSYTCRQCTKNQTALRCKQSTKTQLKTGRKSDSGIIRRPNNFGYCSYIDKLFGLDCFADIVQLKAFTSAKDVSESMAAIQAANNSNYNNQHHGQLKLHTDKRRMKEKKVLCLCIGDGSTPRTAVLSCFLEKKWDCISIDPALHAEWHGINPKSVQRLIGFGGTLEEFLSLPQIITFEDAVVDVDDDDAKQKRQRQIHHYDHLLLLCVHSHARFTGNASVSNIHSMYGPDVPMTIISLPCCPKFKSSRDIGRPPDRQYDDDCVFSACRRVEIWNFEHLQQCGICV